MSYTVILMSFQNIYSINYGATYVQIKQLKQTCMLFDQCFSLVQSLRSFWQGREALDNADENIRISIFVIGNEKNTVVSRSPGQRFTSSGVLGQEKA